MRIEVAICTWNRSPLLQQTLSRLERLRADDVDWQLLVVDNNSTDATADVLRSFARRLPLRSVFEPNPGLSNARNRAVSEVRGEYLVWTDDDVLVDEGWLEAYARAFRRWPDAAFFGGPVEPWFENTPPTWLVDHWPTVAVAYAVRQFGDEPFPFDTSRVPYGANCAFKAEVQRAHTYDPSLGRRPDSHVSGEEADLMRRLLAAGHTGWWVPDARVQHFIPRQRQSVRYLRQIFGGQGELSGRGFAAGNGPRLFGRPRWLMRRALAAECRYRWHRATASPDVWLPDLVDAAIAWGQVKGAP